MRERYNNKRGDVLLTARSRTDSVLVARGRKGAAEPRPRPQGYLEYPVTSEVESHQTKTKSHRGLREHVDHKDQEEMGAEAD